MQTCVADVGKAVALGVVPAVPELGLPAEREVGVHLVLDHLAHLVIIMMVMMVMIVMMVKVKMMMMMVMMTSGSASRSGLVAFHVLAPHHDDERRLDDKIMQ